MAKNTGRNVVLVILGLVALGFITGNVSLGDLNIGSGDEGRTQAGIPSEILGESATVDTKATDRADSTTPQVPVDAYLYDGQDLTNGADFVSKSALSASGLTSLSGLVVGDNYQVVGFNATYPYGNPAGGLIDAKTVRANLNVWGNTASGSVSTTFFDEDDSSSTSITVDSGETYVADGFRVTAGAEDTAYNAHALYFNTTQIDANLDEIRVDGAQEMDSLPDKLSSDFSEAYVAYNSGDLLAGEEPTLSAFQKAKSGAIEIDAKDGQNPSGAIDVCVDDLALFQADDDSIEQGVEDDSDNDVGSSKTCKTITIS